MSPLEGIFPVRFSFSLKNRCFISTRENVQSPGMMSPKDTASFKGEVEASKLSKGLGRRMSEARGQR